MEVVELEAVEAVVEIEEKGKENSRPWDRIEGSRKVVEHHLLNNNKQKILILSCSGSISDIAGIGGYIIYLSKGNIIYHNTIGSSNSSHLKSQSNIAGGDIDYFAAVES